MHNPPPFTPQYTEAGGIDSIVLVAIILIDKRELIPFDLVSDLLKHVNQACNM